MRPADAHLNPHEIELALFGVTGSDPGNTSNSQVLEAQQHLKTCVVCQAMAERYRNAEEMLDRLRAGSKTSFSRGKETQRKAECPVEQTWLLVAAGVIEEEKAKIYVAHAANCDWCGPLLKEAMENLAQDVTQEEEEAMAALPTASRAWQRKMGKILAAANSVSHVTVPAALTEEEKRSSAHKDTGKLPLSRSLRFVWANAVAAVLAIAVWIGWWMIREPDINHLLAQSYQEQRIIQLRISGAKYSSVQTKRGAAGARLSPPVSLLTAESKIQQELKKSPQNQSLLHQKGRAELLEGNYQAAIGTLQQARDLSGGNPMITVDLATAYFQRAETEDKLVDAQKAAELLSAVLQQNPDDEIALFNRAIVYGRLSRHEREAIREAINDWDHYLRVSRDKAWDREATQYLAEMKEKLR
jgi:tetratricopeptide (TPR) repeat protein